MKTATMSDAKLLANASLRPCYVELFWRHSTDIRNCLELYCRDFNEGVVPGGCILDGVIDELWKYVRRHGSNVGHVFGVEGDDVKQTLALCAIVGLKETLCEAA